MWNLEQIQKVIVPEISELLSYANKGKIYFKYGKEQRLLESSYLITDSLNDLSHTALGECVLRLQIFMTLYEMLYRILPIHSPHKSGPHQQWHWQRNTWNPKQVELQDVQFTGHYLGGDFDEICI